jgi:ParB family chromosome partitioning protein
LAIDVIVPNADQPRRRFDDSGLRALAGSLRERGLLQPVLVAPSDENGRHALIAGERRWRAARLAGLHRLPAFIRDEVDGESRLELALMENAAREEPHASRRGAHAARPNLDLTQAELARRIGRSLADLANTMRLLDLLDDVLELLDDGKLSKGHGNVLLGEPDAGRRVQLAPRASARAWSVPELEHAIAVP